MLSIENEYYRTFENHKIVDKINSKFSKKCRKIPLSSGTTNVSCA